MLTPEQAAVVTEFARSTKVLNYQPWMAEIFRANPSQKHKERQASLQAQLEQTQSLWECEKIIKKETLQCESDEDNILLDSAFTCSIALLLKKISIRKPVILYLTFMLGTLESTSLVSKFKGQSDVLRLIFTRMFQPCSLSSVRALQNLCKLDMPDASAVKVVSFFKNMRSKDQTAREDSSEDHDGPLQEKKL